MLKSVRNSTVPRWRVWAEVRRRRQQAIALAQRQHEPQQQQYREQSPLYYDESLFSPSSHHAQTLLNPTPPAQQVLSLLQQNPSQPITVSLSQAAFSPSPENLASLLDALQQYPHLALQTLIWSFRHPGFSVSPLLAPRITPILPLSKPPSVDRFLSDAHAFWTLPDFLIPSPMVDPLLSLYCHAASTLNEILEAFETIIAKGGNPGIHHYNQVLQAMVSKQHNDIDKAQWLFKHMLKKGPRPNTTSYNIYIYGLGEAGNSTEALRLFDEMMANNLPANEVTYSSLISGIVKTGELDKALWLMQEMKYNGLRPSADTYALVLLGLCGKGKYENAASLINEMRTEGISVDGKTYQAMISSLCHVLGVQEAEAYRMLYGENQQAQSY
eukprot:c21766_g1_i1 orf=551-1705(-)